MKNGDVNEYIVNDFHLTPQEKHCVTNLNNFEIKDDKKDLISSIYNFEAEVVRKDVKLDEVDRTLIASVKDIKSTEEVITNDKKEKVRIVTIDDDSNDDSSDENYEQISIFDEFGD